MSDNNNAGEQMLKSLNGKLGFNAAGAKPDEVVFADALEEVQEEMKKELQVKAVANIKKAMDLARKWSTLEKEFNKEKQKMTKELKGIMSGLKAMKEGKELKEEEEEEKIEAVLFDPPPVPTN